VDGSAEMLSSARKRLAGQQNACFVQQPFDVFNEPWGPRDFDLVISAFAIHHLDRSERRRLFLAIARQLNADGRFLNMDVALPDHGEYTEWQYALWSEWIAQHSEKLTLGDTFADVPRKARANPDNKYSPLGEQLDDLREAGFREVECFYKNGVFAVYSGRRERV
jgi:tRNA (cmo5U34)-methyltransferase